MSRQLYPFITPADWDKNFSDCLQLVESGDFKRVRNTTAADPRRNTVIRWRIYQGANKRFWLVMVMTKANETTPTHISLPFSITPEQRLTLDRVPGSDIRVRLVGSSKVWERFFLAIAILRYRDNVLGNGDEGKDSWGKFVTLWERHQFTIREQTEAFRKVLADPADPASTDHSIVCALLRWQN